MPFPLRIGCESPIPLIPTNSNAIHDGNTDAGIQALQVNCGTEDFHLLAQSPEVKRFTSAFALSYLTNSVEQVLIVLL